MAVGFPPTDQNPPGPTRPDVAGRDLTQPDAAPDHPRDETRCVDPECPCHGDPHICQGPPDSYAEPGTRWTCPDCEKRWERMPHGYRPDDYPKHLPEPPAVWETRR